MPKTELKPFLTILGTRTRAKPQDKRHSLRQEILCHKSINNTLLYAQLVTFKDVDFTARVARTEQEACQLIEGGFELSAISKQETLQKKKVDMQKLPK
jgi:hypothetical protein